MDGVRETRNITIETVVHRDTRLMVATSPEMKGLIVHGRSERELQERIPQAIRAILEADGYAVEDVHPVQDEAENAAPDFIRTKRRFQAIAA